MGPVCFEVRICSMGQKEKNIPVIEIRDFGPSSFWIKETIFIENFFQKNYKTPLQIIYHYGII